MDSVTLVLPLAALVEETGLDEETVRMFAAGDPLVAFRRLARVASRERYRAKTVTRAGVRGASCPECGAESGEPCKGSRGQPRSANHRGREVLARRSR